MSWANENPDDLRARGAKKIPMTVGSTGNKLGMTAGSTSALWLFEHQQIAYLSGSGQAFRLSSSAAVASFIVSELNGTCP